MTQVFDGVNLYYDCLSYDNAGDIEKGVLSFALSISGDVLNIGVDASVMSFSFGLSVDAFGGISATGTLSFDFSLVWATTDLLLERFKDSWIKWSQIGSADFTIGRDNISGEMPMDWPGQIYEVKKLGGMIMVYGVNGVSQLKPVQNNFGLHTIYRLGLKSRHAVTGDDSVHYFIDTLGQMWRISDKLTKLDYSEYLSALASPVMSWDNEKNLIYICDGTIGFVYSPDSESLASGPVNVTGIRYQDSTSYVTSPAQIEVPRFSITTDVYDFGTRKEKTIFGLEFSTELEGALQASIEYRVNYKEGFRTLPWVTINPDGRLNLPCYGVEFRFKLRNLIHEYFELDWMKINGVIHGFSHLDIQG